MIIGLLELHHHDKDGSLLGISRGHNIMFDAARVSMLFNPCIIDDVSSFVMYFSEYQETVTTYYDYWNSSSISSYATSTITLSATDTLDSYTKMYTFSGVPTLPGGTARTLRVVGLRISGSTICTAVTLTIPIDHGVSTYVTGYYKLILGITADSTLFGNIYNWRSRTWGSFTSYLYKKDFYPPEFATSNSYSRFNLTSSETISALTTRTQSVYNTLTINSGLTTPMLIGAKLKDRNSSLPLMNNGNLLTRSRVFIHAAGTTDMYGNLFTTQPSSEGAIIIGNSDTVAEYPSAVCLSFQETGEVGVSQYRTIVYPIISSDTNLYTSKFNEVHRSYYANATDNNSQREYLIFNSYFSTSRKWGVIHYTHIYDYYQATYDTFYKFATLDIWYKGLYWTYNSGIPCFQSNGVITDSGILFYAQDATPSILRRYDVERRYEVSYVEETQTLSGLIQGYQIDDSTDELIVVSYEEGSTLVTNGTFDVDASGWTAETSSTITASDGKGVYTAGSASRGFYQVLTTSPIVGTYYQLKIDYINCSSSSYNRNLLIGLYGTEVTCLSTIKIYVKSGGSYTDTGRFFIYDNLSHYVYWNFTYDTVWTELTFDINSISGSSGTMDWQSITRYRIGADTVGRSINFDNIRIYNNYGGLLLTDTCESITHWSASGASIVLDSTTHVEGSYSLKETTLSAGGYAYYASSSFDWRPVPYFSKYLYNTSNSNGLVYKTYTFYFTPQVSPTKLRIWSSSGGATYYVDNISIKRIENGRIYKVDCDDITSYTEYDHSSSNFSSLSEDSMIVPADPSRWYWRVGQGKMIWVGMLSSSKILHYWNGSDAVETNTETTSGTIIDLCVTDDWSKICYAVQNGTTCTWFVRSIADGSRWTLLYSWSSTITGNGGCFVDGNWMFILSGAYSWGYRVNLLTYTIDSWPSYSYSTYTYDNSAQERGIETPNRSIIPGSVMYNFRSIGQAGSYVWPTNGYLILNLVPIDYGWDGTQWIHNYAGNKLTHYDAQNLPLFDTVAFGDGASGSVENYVSGEYADYVVNPSGYCFDNSMTYALNSWVYTGIPVYCEETFSLAWTDPLTPENITITLSKVTHPDWVCFETDPAYVTVTFDTGLKGIQLDSSYTMSYFGEFHIDSATAGTFTFYKDCNLHSVTIKYYWIRRE